MAAQSAVSDDELNVNMMKKKISRPVILKLDFVSIFDSHVTSNLCGQSATISSFKIYHEI